MMRRIDRVKVVHVALSSRMPSTNKNKSSTTSYSYNRSQLVLNRLFRADVPPNTTGSHVPDEVNESSPSPPVEDGSGRRVTGLPKANHRCPRCETTTNAPPGVTWLTCFNCIKQALNRLSRASVPRQWWNRPSRVSVPSPLFSRHWSPKANRCPKCKAQIIAVPGVRQPLCPSCAVDTGSHVPNEVNEVATEVEQEEEYEGGTLIETFTDYRPSRLSIGPLHPDPIVETSSLSAVTPPEPTYDLRIKDRLESSEALSCLQIETLVYASQRHLQHLQNGARAGFFIGDGAGVGKGRTIAGLIWENWHHGRTKALWISVGSDLKFDARRDLDDVGAGCIDVHALNKLPYSELDSKSVEVRNGIIFLTYSSLVATSAQGLSRLQQLVQWCGPGYDGLIIFDECHRAKNLVPEASGKPSLTGKAVLEIQEQLPEARVVYCSATGASESRNMAYMVRLGLWGDGTCFPDFTHFSCALEKGGLGALELVAMDMKARGMYLCRTLSYKGAEFEVVEAPLEATMTEMYIAAVKLWVELREELLCATTQPKQLWRLYWLTHQLFFRQMCMSAKVPTVVRLAKQALNEGKSVVIGLQSTGEARTEDAVAKYGSELDDFISGPRELILKFVEEHCSLSQKPVEVPVHVKHEPTEFEEEFQAGTCEICNYEEGMNKMLQCTTCGQLEHSRCLDPPVVPERTGKWSRDSCRGKPNEHEGFLKCKHKILEKIRSLDLPKNPLDDIIDQLGGPGKVAEITGRRGRLVRTSYGEGVSYQARNITDVKRDMVNMEEKKQFMDGDKHVTIISEAGSAGVSLQANRRAANQRRRVHITLELPWSADRAIQQFGRTHRSNQASAPQYRVIVTNLGGERRFVATVEKRLESLGALTQGDRRAGPSLSSYNYLSQYGRKALRIMYKAILEKATFPVPPPGCSFERPDSIADFIVKAKAALVSVGLVEEIPNGGQKIFGNCGVEHFLNRLLGMQPDIQNRPAVFLHAKNILVLFVLGIASDCELCYWNTASSNCLSQPSNTRFRMHGRKGFFDRGIIDYKAKFIELRGTPKIVHVDHTSGACAKLYTFKVDRGITWEAASALLEEKQNSGNISPNNGFYESERGLMGRRHVFLAYESSTTSGMYKICRPYGGTPRDMSLLELEKKYTKVVNLERAQTGWEDEYTISSKQCLHGPNCKDPEFCALGKSVVKVAVLEGVIFPVWSVVEKTLSEQQVKLHRRMRVMRIETTDGTLRVIGIHIPNAAVEYLLKDLKCVQDVADD